MRQSVKKIQPVATYQIKVTLGEIKPPIWRRVLVPATITLPRLHQLIQIVMGWSDSHLHGFLAGETVYGDPASELDDWMKDETRVRLAEIAPEVGNKFRYDYDFGDDWEHTIVVEKILPAEEIPSLVSPTLPICLTGKRACPPEDCGGSWGYVDFLEAISDPKHEQHNELLAWIGGEFDPEKFDIESVNAKLRNLRL